MLCFGMMLCGSLRGEMWGHGWLWGEVMWLAAR